MKISLPHRLAPGLLKSRYSVIVVACFSLPSVASAGDRQIPRHLSEGAKFGILGASASVFILGRIYPRPVGSSESSSEASVNALDGWMRRRFRGTGSEPRSNFLDSRFGSAITPGAALIGMSIMDIDKREFSRDIPLFLSGLAATKGLTDLTKSLVKRRRPYCIDGGCPPETVPSEDPYHIRSFFSGHSSGAFFSSTFFNKRFRRHMREEWTDDEYRVGRWISPAVSFGWAGIVALSRLHADKHYFTDVLAGGVVGALVAELYYYLAYEETQLSDESGTIRRSKTILSVRISL